MQNVNHPSSFQSDTFVAIPRWVLNSIRLFFAVYSFFVFVGAFVNAVNAGPSLILSAFSSVFFLFWVFFPFIVYRPSYGWVHPLILTSVFSIINIVIRQTGTLMTGLHYHYMLADLTSDQLNLLFAYGNLIRSLALICLYLGFHYGPRIGIPRLCLSERPSTLFFPVLIASFVISSVALLIYADAYGGLYNHIINLSRSQSAKLIVDSEVYAVGHWIELMKLASIAVLIWVCYDRRALLNPLFWVLCPVSLILTFVSSGRRSALLFAIILLGLGWVMRNRTLPYLRVIALGVFCIFMIGLLGVFRTANMQSTERINLDFAHDFNPVEIFEIAHEELVMRSGSGSSFYVVLASVPGEVPPRWGTTYLYWLTQFVPRLLWKDKPRGVDVQAAVTFMGLSYRSAWGIPPGAVGEAYWNFPIIGVIVVFFLYGTLNQWLARILMTYPHSTAVFVIYLYTIYIFNPTQTAFRAWLYSVVPAILLLRVSGFICFRGPVRR